MQDFGNWEPGAKELVVPRTFSGKNKTAEFLDSTLQPNLFQIDQMVEENEYATDGQDIRSWRIHQEFFICTIERYKNA